MKPIKKFVRGWVPPYLMTAIRTLRRSGVYFEGAYDTWSEAQSRSSGYAEAEILNQVRDAVLAVKHGRRAYERDSVLFDEIQYSWPVLAALMWTAARHHGRLHVLDFGGSLGSSYFQVRKFLSDLNDVIWGVVEQAHFVAVGRNEIADERLRFFENIEEVCQDSQPNVILLSSVLQYIESPDRIFEALDRVGADCMIIDRTPFSAKRTDTLVVQHVPPSIYPASYPCWIFSEQTFREKLDGRWDVVETFPCVDGDYRSTGGLHLSYKGMILRMARKRPD